MPETTDIKKLNDFIEQVDNMKKQNKLDLSSDQDLSIAVMNLIAIGHVAEKLESMLSNSLNDCEWDAFGEACLDYLGLGEDELLDMKDTAKDFFGIVEY